MREYNKVFGIGLPKTGTSSLNSALTMLGFRSLHNSKPFIEQLWHTGSYTWDTGAWDAMTNMAEWFFPQMDAAYANSKFILTLRDKQDWLATCARYFSSPNRPEWDKRRLIGIFGIYVFEENTFSHIYDRHLSFVRRFFENRDDILELHIGGGDEWEQICGFLGVNLPKSPFPWENRS